MIARLASSSAKREWTSARRNPRAFQPTRFTESPPMSARRQRSIARPVLIEGFGLFGGADVRMTLLPAEPNSGLVFERFDLPGRPSIPARIEYLVTQPRRTVLQNGTARVEMVEHVLAALAGMWIDNCRIQLDALEPPIGDGSSLEIVEAILHAGVAEQPALKVQVPVATSLVATSGQIGWYRPQIGTHD